MTTPGPSIAAAQPDFVTRLARDACDLRRAQRLRYEVFVEELGGGGVLVDHEARLERDRFDDHFDHILLIDRARGPGEVVGAYRVLRDDQAAAAGQFYSEDEYDLAPLRESGRRLLELGRSCLHADYRGGTGLMHLWSAVGAYVEEHGIDILFGVASFHGTDPSAHAHALSQLNARHLAPPELRVRSRVFQPMDLIPEAEIDRKRAMRDTPALIKGYLRLGGYVGEGAYVDRAFNTTDICLVMDTTLMNARQKALYSKAPPA